MNFRPYLAEHGFSPVNWGQWSAEHCSQCFMRCTETWTHRDDVKLLCVQCALGQADEHAQILERLQ